LSAAITKPFYTATFGIGTLLLWLYLKRDRRQTTQQYPVLMSGVRAGYILYQSHEDFIAAQKQQATNAQ
jgi:hypothetical protein